MLSFSKGLEINTTAVSLSLRRLRPVTDNHPLTQREFLLSGAHLSICFLFASPVSPPYLQSVKQGFNHAIKTCIDVSDVYSYNHTVNPFRSLFLFSFPSLVLSQITFHFTEWLILYYQRKGLYTCAMSCCRPRLLGLQAI